MSVLDSKPPKHTNLTRRATLAHGLGHLLFDPIQRLDRIRVDTYRQTNEIDPQVVAPDYVEQRANAFAIAFLAPLGAVRGMAAEPIQTDAVRKVMSTFGISQTAALYHIRNSLYRTAEVPEDRLFTEPSDEQKAAEDFTLDYFPIPDTPSLRRGRFAGIVTSCYEKSCLTADSAAKYLNCSKRVFKENVDIIRGLYN